MFSTCPLLLKWKGESKRGFASLLKPFPLLLDKGKEYKMDGVIK